MGAWGTGLYQDDIACDIKEEYLNKLRVGKSNIEATQEMIEENYYLIQDNEEGPIFWFALADTQWRYGRLLPEVKKRALKFIKKESDLERWQDNSKQYLKRKKVLDDLKERLNSPQSAEKKISKLKFNRANWEVGDILLYQLTNENIKQHAWYKKYILLKVVGLTYSNIGSLPTDKYYNEYCVIAFYNWIGEKKISPEKIKELNLIRDINIFGKEDIKMSYVSFTKRELQKLNIEVIYKDAEYKNESSYIMDICGKSAYSFPYMDTWFINILEKAKNNGVLIDETNK